MQPGDELLAEAEEVMDAQVLFENLVQEMRVR
jgi:hypothetical protein